VYWGREVFLGADDFILQEYSTHAIICAASFQVRPAWMHRWDDGVEGLSVDPCSEYWVFFIDWYDN